MNHLSQLAAPATLTELITGYFLPIVNSLTVLFGMLALLVFFKGLASFIFKADDSKNHQAGKDLMIYGVIALFVMVSIFGILRFLYGDLGFAFSHPFGLPTFQPLAE
jgi:hypothetical protein